MLAEFSVLFSFGGGNFSKERKKHEKFMVWIFLRPFFKNKIITTRCHQLQEASENMILSIKKQLPVDAKLLGMLVNVFTSKI